jgi:hypothetical protein
MYPEYRYMDFLSEKSVKAGDHPLAMDAPFKPGTDVSISSRRLPVLALVCNFVPKVRELSLKGRAKYS